MHNALTCIFTAIVDNSIRVNSLAFCDFRYFFKNMSNIFAIFLINTVCTINMNLRNNYDMNRSNRINIFKCKNHIVLIHLC